MSPYGLGLACLILLSFALLFLPHRLIAVDLEQSHPARLELVLALTLSAVGAALFLFLAHHSPLDGIYRQVVEGAVIMTLIALVYFDARFFVIPDLYVVILTATALIGPLAAAWPNALAGASLCAGLVGGVALFWRWRTGADGMGLGDIKLAAALGGLLGVERGLWTVSGAACGGAIVGLLDQMRQGRQAAGAEPYVVPFGAALAVVGGAVLLWTTS